MIGIKNIMFIPQATDWAIRLKNENVHFIYSGKLSALAIVNSHCSLAAVFAKDDPVFALVNLNTGATLSINPRSNHATLGTSKNIEHLSYLSADLSAQIYSLESVVNTIENCVAIVPTTTNTIDFLNLLNFYVFKKPDFMAAEAEAKSEMYNSIQQDFGSSLQVIGKSLKDNLYSTNAGCFNLILGLLSTLPVEV